MDQPREPFTTLDGSTVRELIQTRDGATNQSLARATIAPGGETVEHRHRRAEEIYLFTGGSGRMRLGAREFLVEAGDAILIAPGTPHKLWANRGGPLELLCCCAPPYRDDDTELLD